MSTHSIASSRPLEPGKRAIIVGGSSGIGAALAQEMVSRGYAIAVLARREKRLAELCAQINAAAPVGAGARYYAHNVTEYGVVPALFQQIVSELGGLDIFYFVAGAQATMTVDEYSFDKDATMVRVNMLGAMAWLNQASLYFERAGVGQIAAVSSIAADRGRRPSPGYNASKAGLDTYLEGLRNRLTRHGVTVTTIKPGLVDTRLLENAATTFWVVSPEFVARKMADAVQRRRQTVYIPARWRWLSLIIVHMPSFIFRRLNF